MPPAKSHLHSSMLIRLSFIWIRAYDVASKNESTETLRFRNRNTYTKQESKHELMTLKQGTADIGIQTEGIVFINIDDSLLDSV